MIIEYILYEDDILSIWFEDGNGNVTFNYHPKNKIFTSYCDEPPSASLINYLKEVNIEPDSFYKSNTRF